MYSYSYSIVIWDGIFKNGFNGLSVQQNNIIRICLKKINLINLPIPIIKSLIF